MTLNITDDRSTFLVPRPSWVNDLDVSYCSSCNNAFGPLKRRHHCRNCGNIFCHECSSRNVPLPHLGYGTKPVRVCNGCFDVAYLVTYAIDEDHGISTQIHGVRGLLELAEKDDEKDLHNMVAYYGVDALIWLCRSSRSMKLHHLSTTILAMLAEKESIRPVIITKWALPPLLHLLKHYTAADVLRKNSPANSIHSTNGGTPSVSSSNQSSDDPSLSESRQSIILEVIINCTHILYQLSRAGILSQKEVIDEGVLDTLIMLASFKMYEIEIEKDAEDQEQQRQQIKERVTIIQNLAAKAISAISSLITFQASIIEMIKGTEKFSNLLRSDNDEVRKYMAKTIAYLSLRNDKYKPSLLNGNGSKALVSLLAILPQKNSNGKQHRLQDLSYYLSRDIQEEQSIEYNLNSAAVSHACCALANFATNNESQTNLMSQPHLLRYICNVPATFPTHAEIHRHVARCLANLALYEENSKAMLANNDNATKDGNKDAYNVLPALLLMGKSSSPGVQRHIVRAIDNLSSNLPSDSHWRKLFSDAYLYICKILDEVGGDEKDADTIKRAKSIISRKNLEAEQHPEEDHDDYATKEQTTNSDEEVAAAIEKITIENKQGEIEEEVAPINSPIEDKKNAEEEVAPIYSTIEDKKDAEEEITPANGPIEESSAQTNESITVNDNEEHAEEIFTNNIGETVEEAPAPAAAAATPTEPGLLASSIDDEEEEAEGEETKKSPRQPSRNKKRNRKNK